LLLSYYRLLCTYFSVTRMFIMSYKDLLGFTYFIIFESPINIPCYMS